MAEEKNDKYLNQTLINGIKILESFDEENFELTLKEISKNLDLNSSSVWRLVYTLEHIGYLKKLPNEEKYILGFKTLNFGKTILNKLKIRSVAMPYLEELANDLNLNVNLTVLEKEKSVLIVRIPSPEIPDTYFHVGRNFPLYCSSSGKILLANQTPEERERIINNLELKKLTPKTIVDKDELLEHLKTIKEQGYATDDGEYIESTRCMAVPINDRSGEVVASLSISNRKLNMSQEINIKKHLDKVSKTANKISHSLGYSLYNPL